MIKPDFQAIVKAAAAAGLQPPYTLIPGSGWPEEWCEEAAAAGLTIAGPMPVLSVKDESCDALLPSFYRID